MIDLRSLNQKIAAIKAEGRNAVVTASFLEQVAAELSAARGSARR